MIKTAMPSIYPMPGTYETAYVYARLGTSDPDAVIYYTVDGTDPDENSPVFDADKGGIPLLGFAEGEFISKKQVVVKAFSAAEGKAASDVVSFRYEFVMENTNTYRHEVLREGTEDTPALFRIVDFTCVSMYLIVGTKRALLIDAGDSNKGDLAGLVKQLCGDKPFDVMIAHAHIDHIGQVQNMLDAGVSVYVSDRDLPTFGLMGGTIPSGTVPVSNGDIFDLGNAKLIAYDCPGHSPGGMVILNEKTGDLYSSDLLGSNDPMGPNSGLLVIGREECSAERYYHTIVNLKKLLDGRAKRIFMAHTTYSIQAETYLNNLINAFANILEQGEEALVPSTRPIEGVCGAGCMVGSGNYRTDMENVGMNVKFIYEKDAQCDPPRYAKGFNSEFFRNMFKMDPMKQL